MLKSGFVTRNYIKIGLVKLLKPIWKGVVYSKISPFKLADVPEPKISDPNHVIVKQLRVGLCGTDVAILKAQVDLKVAPAALSQYSKLHLGHELIGEVIEVGSKVKNLNLGDRVGVMFSNSCSILELKECESCLNGSPFLCKNASNDHPHHLEFGGGFSEYFEYHENQLFRVPEDIPTEIGVLAEPLGIGIKTIMQKLPREDENVLIWGFGFIGLSVLLALKYFAPRCNIFVIAKHDFQINLARKYGATTIQKDDWAKIAEVTDGNLFQGLLGNKMILGGFDVIYDCVASNDTISNSLRWVKAKGTLVMVGINLNRSKIDLTPIWYQEVNFIGSNGSGEFVYNGDRVDTYDLVFQLLRSEDYEFQEFITHSYSLEEYKKAISTFNNKKETQAIKIIFNFENKS